jgi:hypothetical protein
MIQSQLCTFKDWTDLSSNGIPLRDITGDDRANEQTEEVTHADRRLVKTMTVIGVILTSKHQSKDPSHGERTYLPQLAPKVSHW